MHSNLFFGIAIIWTTLITILCLISPASIPGVSVPNGDKIVHAILYFFFTIFWYIFFKGQMQELEVTRVLLFVFLVAAMYGVIIELSQEVFTTARKADINDVFANMTGSLLAVGTLYTQDKFRQRRNNIK